MIFYYTSNFQNKPQLWKFSWNNLVWYLFKWFYALIWGTLDQNFVEYLVDLLEKPSGCHAA